MALSIHAAIDSLDPCYLFAAALHPARRFGSENFRALPDRAAYPSAVNAFAVGIALTALALLGASSLDRQLGLPTFMAAAAVTIIVLIISRQSPLPVLRDISWGVLPLVAGLFHTGRRRPSRPGSLNAITQMLHEAAALLSPRGFFRCGRHRRLGIEPDEQSSNRPGRSDGQPKRRCPAASDKRNIDRVDPRPKSVGDGFAGNDSLVDRASKRRRGCHGMAIPEAWNCRDAAGVAGRLVGRVLRLEGIETAKWAVIPTLNSTAPRPVDNPLAPMRTGDRWPRRVIDGGDASLMMDQPPCGLPSSAPAISA